MLRWSENDKSITIQCTEIQSVDSIVTSIRHENHWLTWDWHLQSMNPQRWFFLFGHGDFMCKSILPWINKWWLMLLTLTSAAKVGLNHKIWQFVHQRLARSSPLQRNNGRMTQHIYTTSTCQPNNFITLWSFVSTWFKVLKGFTILHTHCIIIRSF